MDTIVPNNPYVGPRSIKTGEAFFGRDREIRSLSALLVSERIVMLHSPSGAGKSSLIQAGLIPNMKERFSIFPLVRVNMEPPDEVEAVEGLNRYVFSTLLALEEGLPRKDRMPYTDLAALTIDSYLEQRALPDPSLENCLLLFDQFEEVLTASPTDQLAKQAFFEQLGEALQNRRRWALFAIREDYMGGLAPYVRAIPNRLSVTFRLALLGPDAAKLAIQQPSLSRGVDFTNDAAQKLVDDLRRIQVQQADGSFLTEDGPSVEPVQLQVVCFNLWQSHSDDDKTIDESDLQRVGSVDQALASYYANAVRSVAESKEMDERVLRRWFDRYLITPDGIRSQVLRGIKTTEGLPNIVLRLLENTHLIRGETRAGKMWYELSHDRLVKPVVQDNAKWFEANLSLLQKQASIWSQQGRGDGLLLRDDALIEAERGVNEAELLKEEKEFLDACRKLREQDEKDTLQRRIMLFGLFAALFFLVLSIGGFIYAARSAAAAQKSADEAIAANNTATLALGVAERANSTAWAAATNAQAAANLSKQEAERANISSTRAAESKATAEKLADEAAQAQATAQQSANEVAAALAKVESVAGYRADALADLARNVRLSNPSLSALLTIEAFKIVDNYRTRSNLMELVQNQLKLQQVSDPNSDGVFVVTFSPDGNWLASGNRNGTITIWSMSSFARQQIKKSTTEGKYSIAFDPSGAVLAAGSFDNTITLWDVQTLEMLGSPLTGHGDWVYTVTYSPDGSILASGSADNSIILWDAKTRTQMGEPLVFQSDKVFDIDFSPQGKILASASRDKTIVLIDMTTRQTIGSPLRGHTGFVFTLDYSPNGITLASGGADNRLIFWDVVNRRMIGRALTEHQSSITSVNFNPNGNMLASASEDGTVIIWDVETRQLLWQFSPSQSGSNESFPNSVEFNPAGTILAVGNKDGIVTFWDFSEASWIEKACKLAGRSLTLTEWSEYFPGESYRETCP